MSTVGLQAPVAASYVLADGWPAPPGTSAPVTTTLPAASTAMVTPRSGLDRSRRTNAVVTRAGRRLVAAAAQTARPSASRLTANSSIPLGSQQTAACHAADACAATSCA